MANLYEYVDVDLSSQSAPMKRLRDIAQCAVCLQPLSRPKRAPCAHSLCEQCWATWLSGHKTCPVCNNAVCANALRDETDKNLLGLLDHLRVHCGNKNRSCAWTGPRAAVADHMRLCVCAAEHMSVVGECMQIIRAYFPSDVIVLLHC